MLLALLGTGLDGHVIERSEKLRQCARGPTQEIGGEEPPPGAHLHPGERPWTPHGVPHFGGLPRHQPRKHRMQIRTGKVITRHASALAPLGVITEFGVIETQCHVALKGHWPSASQSFEKQFFETCVAHGEHRCQVSGVRCQANIPSHGLRHGHRVSTF